MHVQISMDSLKEEAGSVLRQYSYSLVNTI